MNLQILIESVNNSQEEFNTVNDALKSIQDLVNEITSSFEKFASAMNKSMEDATSTIEKASTPLKEIGSNLDALKSPITNTENQLKDLTKPIDDVIAGIDKISSQSKTSFQDAVNATKPFEDAVNSAVKPLEDVSSAVDDIATQAKSSFNDAAEAVKPFDDAVSGSIKPIDDVISSIDDIVTQANTSFNDAADAIKPLVDQVNALNESLKATVTEMSGVAKEAEAMGKSESAGSEKVVAPGAGGKKGASSMQGMGMMMAGMQIEQATKPIEDALSKAIDSFADFDKSMRLVNEEAKLGESKFKDYEKSVISLSNTTGISAQDLSNGLYNILSTGLTDAAGGMKVLESAAKGAKAGHADLNDTTKALDSVMGAYGMKADQVSKILDIMFKATNDGQMHFDDLAKSVGASSTSAAIAGVKYNELAASQATLTNVGKSAQLASQQLNSLINGIIKPTAQASKEAKSLGIEWDAGALKAHGLSYMIDEATKATDGNAQTLGKLIPNQRAWQAAVALGSTAHQLYTKTLNDMKDATGSTDEALVQANKSAGDSIDKMKTQITNAGMSLAQTLMPAILTIITGIEKLVNWFNGLSDGTKKFIGIFAGLTVAFGAIVGPILTFIGTLSMVAAGFDIAMGPLLLIIAGIMALIAVVALIVANWGPIKEWFADLWKNISSNFKTSWDGLVNGVSSAIKSISDGISGLVKGVTTFFSNMWTSITNNFKTSWDGLVSGVINAKNNISNEISNIVKGTENLFSNMWRSIAKFFSDAWSGLISGITSAKTNMSNGIDAIVKAVTGFFSTMWKDIKKLFGDAWEAIVKGIVSAKTNVSNAVSSIIDTIRSFFTKLPSEALQWGSDLIDGLVKGIEGAISKVTSAVSNVANTVKSFLHFSTPDEGPLADYESWMPDFIDGLTKGITDNKSKLTSAIQSMAGNMSTSMTATLNSSASPVMAGGAGGSNQQPVFYINVTGNVAKNEKDLADTVSKGIWQKMKTQGKF